MAYGKDVDSFKKKEIITIDEMKNNVEKLSELSDNLTAAMDELDVSNLLMCNVTFRCNLSDLLSWYSQYMSMLSCPLQCRGFSLSLSKSHMFSFQGLGPFCNLG